MQAVEMCDQFVCRAYFALGVLVSENSKTLKGRPLVDGTMESIKHVMRGLDIATANERYLFLVFNGSVHHWHVSRPLQRDSMRAHLLPSMEKVMAALEKVPGQDEWKVSMGKVMVAAFEEVPGQKEWKVVGKRMTAVCVPFEGTNYRANAFVRTEHVCGCRANKTYTSAGVYAFRANVYAYGGDLVRRRSGQEDRKVGRR